MSTIFVLGRAGDNPSVWRKKALSLFCLHPPLPALQGSPRQRPFHTQTCWDPDSLPPPPSLATGPPALGAIGRWQPDQTKTRIRRASAHVASTHVRATSLVSSGPQLPLPPAVRLELTHQFPSSPHQVLPLIFLCQSQKSGIASPCDWNLPFFTYREKPHLLPCPLVFSFL